LFNTLKDLLPENIAKKSPCWPLTSAIKPAIGHLSVFIGIKGSSKDLGLSAQNVWFSSYTDPDLENVIKFVLAW
jgi:all-trans-retinol 13,14-reductase